MIARNRTIAARIATFFSVCVATVGIAFAGGPQLDPAMTYANVNLKGTESKTVTFNVPAGNYTTILQQARVGTLKVDIREEVVLMGTEAPAGVSATVKSTKLMRERDGYKLQFEVAFKSASAGLGVHTVKMIFENKTSGAKIPVGVVLNVQ